uniref:RING-type E3 ubiquitin transferase n=1 Tax=Opuntia streptacantha TaxID=393608 RepID=A0A7C9FJC4_OPUST
MEGPAPGMEEDKKLEEAKLTSAAAFVEGGIQDACDDSCSICLEEFCESDPSTVTGCKHEFHLQCILECQELLDAVVQERNLRLNPPRNAAIFHHPVLGEFEIQHLPVGVNDAELEERIIQHLAAAAAMGRTRHYARRELREGHRGRSSAQGRQHFLVFSSPPNAQAGASPERGLGESLLSTSIATPSSPLRIGGEASPSISSPNRGTQRNVVSASGTSVLAATQQLSPSNSGMSSNHSSPRNEDRAGPSDLQSFSETLKSRLNAMSMRYKESISKSTRGWKERWFSRNASVSDSGSEVQREATAGIATVSQMMEHLETEDNERMGSDSLPNGSESSARDASNQYGANSIIHHGGDHLGDDGMQAPCATQSGPD